MATKGGDAREFLQIHYYLSLPMHGLCMLVGVPVWHIDVLKTPPGTVDIGLIRDEAN